MKKAMILFVILFLATLLIPMISLKKQETPNKEVVTIFNSTDSVVANDF